VGKMVLPFLGGSASAWTTAVLFFQLMLLGGYFYADRLVRIRSLPTQGIIHILLMVAAVAFLPVRFGADSLVDDTYDHPALWELLGLFKSAGVPYFVICTTAPLLQSWFGKADDVSGRDPFYLYAASNTGSLLALLVYPFLVEPAFGVREQSLYWTGGYVVLIVLSAVMSIVLLRAQERDVHVSEPETVSRPDPKTRVGWIAAAFVPSGLMLAVTTHISINLVPMPLVWTLPLAVYLVTFIVAFSQRIRVSSQRVAQLSLPVIVLFCPVVGLRVPVVLAIDMVLLAIHLALLFAGGLLCHTALAERRPDRRYLTEYYLYIAFGGALGGVFAAVVAPMAFTSILEYPLLLASTIFFRHGFGRLRWIIASALACLILGYALYLPAVLGEKGDAVYATRNFFGVKRVIDTSAERKLLHGDTLHGVENRDTARAGEPTIYYRRDGPLGDVMEMMRDRPDQHAGVVGLGAGAIAAYAGPDRHVTFFEVDPDVESIAVTYFTFLNRCGGHCTVASGDGRLEIARSPEEEFDLIVLDAFSSDVIPPHLVSREALDVYLSRLKPHGVLLFHASNRYLRVKDLLSALVVDAGLPSLLRDDRRQDAVGGSDSIWLAAAKSREALGTLSSLRTWTAVARPPEVRVWTDDYSSLVNLLQWEPELR
ncbi:MAG TPA: fused MFS/spermidine synthase, partial [Terriglobia bacterium]|nr:fused MFS/spermidine synthase [Terriglobia bacterium]